MVARAGNEEGQQGGVAVAEVDKAMGAVTVDRAGMVTDEEDEEDEEETPALGPTTAGATERQIERLWPRGRTLWQRPESPGRQREQRIPLRTQAHLRHLAVPLQRQQRVLGAEEPEEPDILHTLPHRCAHAQRGL